MFDSTTYPPPSSRTAFIMRTYHFPHRTSYVTRFPKQVTFCMIGVMMMPWRSSKPLLTASEAAAIAVFIELSLYIGVLWMVDHLSAHSVGIRIIVRRCLDHNDNDIMTTFIFLMKSLQMTRVAKQVLLMQTCSCSRLSAPQQVCL